MAQPLNDLDPDPLDVIEFRRAELVGWADEMGPGMARGRVVFLEPLGRCEMVCSGVVLRVRWDELVTLSTLRGRAA